MPNFYDVTVPFVRETHVIFANNNVEIFLHYLLK